MKCLSYIDAEVCGLMPNFIKKSWTVSKFYHSTCHILIPLFSTNHQEMVKSVPYACTIKSVKFIVILWWFNEIFQKQIYRSFQSWAVRKVLEFAKACSKTVCIICLAPDWNRVIARGSEKGRSLISAYRSLAITASISGFEKLSRVL